MDWKSELQTDLEFGNRDQMGQREKWEKIESLKKEEGGIGG